MPLPKTFAKPAANPARDTILISTHSLARLCGVHDDTVLRLLSAKRIVADSWADLDGRVVPLFSPTMAIVIAGLRTPLPHDSTPPAIC